jgi:hypothetical protein
MKIKSLLSGISIVLILLMMSCSRSSQEEKVLATRIQYDVPIINADSQLDWWINNLEGSRREPFLQRVMEAVEKGEVTAYDYFNKPLTPEQVKASLSDTVFQTLLRNRPPYEEYDTMVIITVSYRDISKLRFLEEWRWHRGDLNIEKKVIGFGPVIQREVAGEAYNQLLFWILQ